MIAPFWRETPEWTLSFSREKYSVHSGVSLQKEAIIVRYGFRFKMVQVELSNFWSFYVVKSIQKEDE